MCVSTVRSISISENVEKKKKKEMFTLQVGENIGAIMCKGPNINI